MSDSNRGELRSEAKDEDNIRFTQRYCLGLRPPCTAVPLNEVHVEATSDHTQDGKHTGLPHHLSHIKGIYSIDHEALFDSIQLSLSLWFHRIAA